jgi:hypothetical protein
MAELPKDETFGGLGFFYGCSLLGLVCLLSKRREAGGALRFHVAPWKPQ